MEAARQAGCDGVDGDVDDRSREPGSPPTPLKPGTDELFLRIPPEKNTHTPHIPRQTHGGEGGGYEEADGAWFQGGTGGRVSVRMKRKEISKVNDRKNITKSEP